MKKTTKNARMGMLFGMCFGTTLGVIFEELGIALGICFGMLLGVVFGMQKDKLINEQLEEKCYTIKGIHKDDSAEEYTIALTNKQGEEQTVKVTTITMESEQFEEGDIVFMDEDGDIEQAFDKDEE